jgi:hypothetical protein
MLPRLAVPVVRAALATTRAAGKGALKGVQNAARSTARNEASRFLRSKLHGAPPMLGPVLSGQSARGPSMFSAIGLMPPYFRMPEQQFPAVCACDYNARAPRMQNGRKLFKCHSCATKGKGARNYRVELEGRSFVERGRASAGVSRRVSAAASGRVSAGVSRRVSAAASGRVSAGVSRRVSAAASGRVSAGVSRRASAAASKRSVSRRRSKSSGSKSHSSSANSSS